MNIKLILVLILSSLAVLFIAQNSNVVEIGFLLWKMPVSTALLIFFTLMMGFLLGWFMHGFALHRKAKKDESIYLR